MTTDVEISRIVEGERHRHDLGDIKSLAESMTEVGLLHPVVLTEDMHLIAGGRRIAAARSLGWVDISATVVRNLIQADALLRAEADENTCRKDFTPTEALAIKQSREALLKPLAKQRMSDGGKGAQLAHPSTRTEIASARGTGYSPTTLRKVEAVKNAAENPATPDPVREIAKAALVDMDRTGKVDRPHQQVQRAQAAADAAPVADALGLDQNQTFQRLDFQARLARDISRASGAILSYSADEVGEWAETEQLDSIEELGRSITNFADRARQAAPKGLRVVGGKQ